MRREVFGWSFVLELLASEDTIELVDDKEKGLGRVKDTPWWMGARRSTLGGHDGQCRHDCPR